MSGLVPLGAETGRVATAPRVGGRAGPDGAVDGGNGSSSGGVLILLLRCTL